MTDEQDPRPDHGDEKTDRGVLYIATGEEYVGEAARSARSVRAELPDVEVSIVTDEPDVPAVFDDRISLADPTYSNLDKVANVARSPYEQTVFLDTDTYLHQADGLLDLFALLEEFDLAVCHGLGRRLEIAMDEGELPAVDVPPSFAWFNSGVLAFRNTADVEGVFEEWERLLRAHRAVNPDVLDQGAFREAVYHSDLRVATLPFEYNYHVMHPQAVGDVVRLLHGHVDNFEAVAARVNADPETKRYFHAIGGGRSAHVWQPNSWAVRARKIRFSIQERGLATTAVKLVESLRGGTFWPT